MNKTNVVARWSSGAPYLLSALRIGAAFLIVQFGTAKLFAFPAAVLPGGGTASLASLPGVAGVLETFGGALLLVGLFTRPVAFLLSGEMAFAYFIGHAPRGFWPVQNNGHSVVMFCFVWLYLSAAGAGPWSLDASRRNAARSSRRPRADQRVLQVTTKPAAPGPVAAEDGSPRASDGSLGHVIDPRRR